MNKLLFTGADLVLEGDSGKRISISDLSDKILNEFETGCPEAFAPTVEDIIDASVKLKHDEETRELLQKIVDAGRFPAFGFVFWDNGDGTLGHIKVRKDLFPEGVACLQLPCPPEEYSKMIARGEY